MALFCLPEFLYDFSYGWAFAHQRSGATWLHVVMSFGHPLRRVRFRATAVWRMEAPPYKPPQDKPGLTDPDKEGSTLVEILLFALPVLLSAWLLGEASFWAYVKGALTNQWLFLPTSVLNLRSRLFSPE